MSFIRRNQASLRKRIKALRVGGVAASLLGVTVGTGCDKLGFTTDDLLAKLPEEFTETPSTARIVPVEGFPLEEIGTTKTLTFHELPSASHPYCGAVLRLRSDTAVDNPVFQKYLLPRLIIRYSGAHPAAVTTSFGGSVEEIRRIVPAGDHYLGLIPQFKQDWLSDLGVSGAGSMNIKARASWSRMSSDDLAAEGSFSVSSIYHFPREDFFPLFISLVSPTDRTMPPGYSGGGVGEWVNGVLLKRVFPKVENARLAPDDRSSGWVKMRPIESSIQANDVTQIEAAIVLASMALRDGIECWFAFFPDTIFLFLGGGPNGGEGYAFSIDDYLTGERSQSALLFLENSRKRYLASVTTKGEPKFFNAADHNFFHPIHQPEKKADKGRDAPRTKARPQVAPANPFESAGGGEGQLN